MTRSKAPRQPNTGPLIAAILTISMVGVGLTIVGPVISIRLENAGYAASTNGLSMSLAGLANILLIPLAPRLLGLMGARALINVSLLAVAAILLLGALITQINWLFALRFAFSAVLGLLFTVSEYIVSARAPPTRRGLWSGLYTASLGLGFFIGPLALSFLAVEGPAPFFVAAFCALAAIAPISLFSDESGLPTTQPHNGDFRSAFRTAPDLMLSALIFGAIETSAMVLLPVYALRNGMDVKTSALLTACMALGNVMFQLPIGLIGDRAPRKFLLAAIGVTGAVGALCAPLIKDHTFAFAALLVVWGGVVSAIYTVALAELGDRIGGDRLAAANASLVIYYSLGMAMGPPVLGIALDASPKFGLFLALAGVLIAYVTAISVIKPKKIPL